MKENKLMNFWRQEESVAHIHGWDFSHIQGRYTEETDLPWDYKRVILHHLKPEMKLLDVDTGGGEFLLSLHHPHANTSATEAYPPNVQLCNETLLPLGVDFRTGDGKGILPFSNQEFDMVINRHGDFKAKETYRVLKNGGIFITEQVGAENDRELVELLLGNVPLPFPGQYLMKQGLKFLMGKSVLRQSSFLMWVRWSGLLVSSSGNFLVSLWRSIKIDCKLHNKF